jgi:hypothetical protein
MEQLHILLDAAEHDKIADKGPSLYHLLKSRKRQEARVIHSIHDSNGNLQSSSTHTLRTFTAFLRMKYESIQVDEDCVNHMANALHKMLPHAANTALDAPVTIDELHLAVRNRKPYKAPGCDGVCQ